MFVYRILQLTVLNLQMKKPICKCRTVVIVVYRILPKLVFCNLFPFFLHHQSFSRQEFFLCQEWLSVFHTTSNTHAAERLFNTSTIFTGDRWFLDFCIWVWYPPPLKRTRKSTGIDSMYSLHMSVHASEVVSSTETIRNLWLWADPKTVKWPPSGYRTDQTWYCGDCCIVLMT